MSKERIFTSGEVIGFLKDFKENSRTEIVEGSEKNELLKVAKARGYQTNAKDLGLFKSIWAFAEKANSNGDRLPEKELLKILPQIIGKPVNRNHLRPLGVKGHYIDYKYIKSTKTVIVYGVFYKSYYPDEWEEAKKLHKRGKLSSSFEIWSPDSKRIKQADGTFKLTHMEIAGGALVYEDIFNKPAYKDAKALAVAKENAPEDLKLIIAKAEKYKQEEIITAETADKIVEKPINPAPVVPTVTMVKCQNCEQEFDYTKIPATTMGAVKCPNCKAIIDQTGKVLYPPQVRNWKINCPNCRSSNWLIKKETPEVAEIKCMDCSEEYTLNFKKDIDISYLKSTRIKPIYFGTASCPQCGTQMGLEDVATAESREIKCRGCGIKFPLNIKKNLRKFIDKIEVKSKQIKAQEEKEEMKGLIISKYHRIIDVENFDDYAKTILPETEEGLETSARLTYQQKKSLPDSDFAVVVRVKNKRTGKMRKVRKYLINDPAHVRNALARLAQPKAKETLRELGVSIESVKRKILARARKFKMTELLERHKANDKSKEAPKAEVIHQPEAKVEATVVKATEKINSLKKAVRRSIKRLVEATRKLENQDKELKEAKAKLVKIEEEKLVEARRKELGKYADELSDEQVINDETYKLQIAKKKETEEKIKKNTATDDVGELPRISACDDKIVNTRKGVEKILDDKYQRNLKELKEQGLLEE